GVGHRLRVSAGGHLSAHLDQRGGVQHAGYLVDRQQLPIGELVATIQRHHVLSLQQRRFTVVEHDEVSGDIRIGGGGPRRHHLTGLDRGEKLCVVCEFASCG